MTNEEAIKILEYPVKKWSMEWDEREDGLSYYEALDMAISALRQQEAVTDRHQMANADRIRAMNDEELAEFIKHIKVRAAFCKAVKNNNAFEELCSTEWLQMPAEDDDHA